MVPTIILLKSYGPKCSSFCRITTFRHFVRWSGRTNAEQITFKRKNRKNLRLPLADLRRKVYDINRLLYTEVETWLFPIRSCGNY